jgi:hypothetical protein
VTRNRVLGIGPFPSPWLEPGGLLERTAAGDRGRLRFRKSALADSAVRQRVLGWSRQKSRGDSEGSWVCAEFVMSLARRGGTARSRPTPRGGKTVSARTLAALAAGARRRWSCALDQLWRGLAEARSIVRERRRGE